MNIRVGSRGRGLLLSAALALGGMAGVAGTTTSSTAVDAALPTGLSQQVVFSDLDFPMDVEFSPDGRVYVAEKNGLVKEFDGLSDTTPTTVVDLRARVFNNHDRGLLSIALAPTFPTDPHLYALYSADAEVGGTGPIWGNADDLNDNCPILDGACVVSGRLVRLDLSRPNGGMPEVLVDDWCQQFDSHSIGHLEFGADGYLYASGGDGASYAQPGDWGQQGREGSPANACGDPPGPANTALSAPTAEGGALRSQDIQTSGDPLGLDGTIIRIDPATGAGAPGNPLSTSTSANARRVVAVGFRNPFRYTFRPGTKELWIGDVGFETTEEINELDDPTAGGVDNFGWPCREGNVATPQYTDQNLCKGLNNGTTARKDPYFSYEHRVPVVSGDGCTIGGSAISSVQFYSGTTYPTPYKGALFFGDFGRQCLWTMPARSDGKPDASKVAVFSTGVIPLEIETGPGGDLYYVNVDPTDYSGSIRRIYATGANHPPVAAIKATPDSGSAAPLPVSFSAAGSTDLDGADSKGDIQSYAWDLDNDGAFDDATGVTANKTFTAKGKYTVRVRVTDKKNLTDIATATVLVGLTAPTATIADPGDGFTWSSGSPITFTGSATDAEDGALPASKLQWSWLLYHCATVAECHTHPQDSFNGVSTGSFLAPTHEYPAYLEVRLTATDSSGLKTTVSRRISPDVRTVTVDTEPSGLDVILNGNTVKTPATQNVIQGTPFSLDAPSSQTVNGDIRPFTGWSDCGTKQRDITPAGQDIALTALYGAEPTCGPPTGAVSDVRVKRKRGHRYRVVTWVAPPPDPGAPFSGYRVTVTKGTKTLLTTTVSTPTVVLKPRQLKRGRLVIHVQAQNGKGLGPIASRRFSYGG